MDHRLWLLPASKSKAPIFKPSDAKNPLTSRGALALQRKNCNTMLSSCMPVIYFMLRYLRKNCFKHCTSERKDGFVNYLPVIPSFTILSLFRSRNVHTFVSYSQNLHELHKPKHRIKLHKQKHKMHLAQPRRRHPTFRCTLSTSIIRSDGPNTAGCLFLLVVSTIYYMSLLYQYPDAHYRTTENRTL